MESELEKVERKRKKLFDDYDDEVYTREEFIERKMHFAQTIDSLKAQISEAKSNTPEVLNYEEKIINLHDMIDCIQNPNVSAFDKNEFLKQYIADIHYDIIDYGKSRGGKPVLDVVFR